MYGKKASHPGIVKTPWPYHNKCRICLMCNPCHSTMFSCHHTLRNLIKFSSKKAFFHPLFQWLLYHKRQELDKDKANILCAPNICKNARHFICRRNIHEEDQEGGGKDGGILSSVKRLRQKGLCIKKGHYSLKTDHKLDTFGEGNP